MRLILKNIPQPQTHVRVVVNDGDRYGTGSNPKNPKNPKPEGKIQCSLKQLVTVEHCHHRQLHYSQLALQYHEKSMCENKPTVQSE